jgi:hypothetical protein
MLDFDPFAPLYPPHVHDNDHLFRPHVMQADPLAYNNPYSPPPTTALGKFAFNSLLAPPSPAPPPPPYASSPALLQQQQPFTFDPFADEDSSTSSGASELEVHRLRRIEFLRRREWMRRVVAWVDGISHGTVSTSVCVYALPFFSSPSFSVFFRGPFLDGKLF